MKLKPAFMNKQIEKYEADKAYFLTFCIEQYAHRHELTGKDAAEEIFKSGTAEYLNDNFEVLHTQSSQWLMEEVDERVKQSRI